MADEFSGAELGDARLTSRLVRVADAVAGAPGDSLPKVAGSDSELEGVYRFLSNARVSPGAILQPHFSATCRRAGDAAVLVIHDTTQFTFGGLVPRRGLGALRSQRASQGFFAHFALGIEESGARRPLGLLGLKTIVRRGKPLGRRVTGPARIMRDNKESDRWADLALEVDRRVPTAIHVMDREADSFDIFAKLKAVGARFVIRMREGKVRVAEDRNGSRIQLANAVACRRVVLTRTVALSRRLQRFKNFARQPFPARAERMAKLEVRATSAKIPRPLIHPRRQELPKSLMLNVVLVREVDVPRGAAPVSWMLATTEPVSTAADVARVIDAYRTRWVIEEFFKALKTGCAFEKRQLETFHSLVNALAVFSVVAWRLLLLRNTARGRPGAAASEVLTAEQLRVLVSLSRMKERGVPNLSLPKSPTVADAVAAVAKLGGHIKNNGPPGWQVLGRGYDALLLLQTGWRARAAEM